MDSLEAAFDAVEDRRKSIDVYTDVDDVVSDLEMQFSTRNVDITRQRGPPIGGRGFVIIRDAVNDFRGALSIDRLDALLSPEIHPPWQPDSPDDITDVFSFLDNTVFTSFHRRHLLAVAREIEERAWRTETGVLYVGFQRAGAFEAQREIYDRIAAECDLTIRIFIEDEWESTLDASIDVVTDSTGEIGRFWFVLFTGGPTGTASSGLLAEEQDPGRYYGFWTDDTDRVGALVSYLDATYVSDESSGD